MLDTCAAPWDESAPIATRHRKTAMKVAKLATDGTLMFWCPACDEHHGIPVDGSRGWKWNGSLEFPTVTPSILVRQTLYGPERLTFPNYHGPVPCEASEGICHSFVTDGKIEYCGDSTHSLKGQTVPLPAIDH